MKERNFSQTRQELLNNTIKYYSADPVGRRASTITSGCQYINKDGNSCAIGREVMNPQFLENLGGVVDDVFDKLPKRLQNMGKGFLTSIQSLHDVPRFWDAGGLTTLGEHKVTIICNSYQLTNPLVSICCSSEITEDSRCEKCKEPCNKSLV